jgi:hypothetical protein
VKVLDISNPKGSVRKERTMNIGIFTIGTKNNPRNNGRIKKVTIT